MAYEFDSIGLSGGSASVPKTEKDALASSRIHVEKKSSEDFQEMMLNVRAYRQQVLASNIANSDTPGFKAMDIDITDVVAQSSAVALSLSTSSSRHFISGADRTPEQFTLKYRVPYQGSLDGNTVEMDIERQKFSENALMYQFSLDRVSGEFKHMQEMLRDLK